MQDFQLQELERQRIIRLKPFGILINCYAAVHRSETKQQHLTLGDMPAKVHPAVAAAAQIPITFFLDGKCRIYLCIYFF